MYVYADPTDRLFYINDSRVQESLNYVDVPYDVNTYIHTYIHTYIRRYIYNRFAADASAALQLDILFFFFAGTGKQQLFFFCLRDQL